MNKVKLMLILLIFAAGAAAAIAFKTERQPKIFYKLGTTIIGGQTCTGCVVPVTLLYTPNPVGIYTEYSSTFACPATTCNCRVIQNL